MPIIEHRRKETAKSESNWLLASARNVTSQIGQDGIIEKIFSIIGTSNKLCVEFGAWDGKTFSNTWNLIENHGWNGLLIEANEAKFRDIAQNHTSGRVTALNRLVELSGDNSLESIVLGNGPSDPDFVSIDIDGNDWHVWNSLNKVRPRLVLIEFNPTIPNDVYFVQDADFSVNQGASLLAMIELGRSKGYSLVCVDMWDAFFVPDELYPLFSIADNSIDAMYDPQYETKFFQGYDGTIYLAGTLRLLWSGIDFRADELQLLPDERRVYGDRPS